MANLLKGRGRAGIKSSPRYSPVPPSAPSVLKGNLFSKVAMSASAHEAGWIDSCERRILEPPPKPSSQLKPVEPQRRLQERLEKPVALRLVEPPPALQRRLGQISAPHLVNLKAKFSKEKSQKTKNAITLKG